MTIKQTEGPNLCPRCKKGWHWTKDCRSKTDINEKVLAPVSGNCVRGQPQALKQCYGAVQENHQGLISKPESEISIEPPQAAQDWTSVPPPIQS